MQAINPLVTRLLATSLFYSAEILPYLPTYINLLVTALLPIVAGAYASLKRPANASRPANGDDTFDEDDDEKEEAPPQIENLTASDALFFPLIAGVCLGGFYLLIKYLKDPAIISTILTYYFCGMGVFTVGKGFSDSLGVLVSCVFPKRYRSKENGKIYVAGYSSYRVRGEEALEERNPLGALLPCSMWDAVWSLRRILAIKWCVVVRNQGGKPILKHTFWIGDFAGWGFGAFVVGTYAIGGKHWVLTNVMGTGFAYGAMQLISPTTFTTATLLLGALFFYDVFFVFYTPIMVTVATNLDVPIKLLFPRPGTTESGAPALAMLGLGDVVIPGLAIAMALRWDLWRFYEQKRLSNLAKAEKEQSPVVDSDGHDLKRRRKDLAQKTKSTYIKVTGNWGERFWTNDETKADFNKIYFHVSLVGYVIGMLTTLVVMHVWQHAQPALLYLVPGVLGSIWGTALMRGEAGMMWKYSEEEEDETRKPTDADTTKTGESEGGDEEEIPSDAKPDKPGEGLESEELEECVKDEEWVSVIVTKRSTHLQKPKIKESPSSSAGEESETFSPTSSVSSLGS